MKKINQKGFTLIELLVVIAIIGLLSTLAVVALNNARQKSRDAKRVADVKQIQTALELFYNEYSGYPDMASGAVSGLPTADANFSTFMAQIPTNPTPRTDGGCADQDYLYVSCPSTGACDGTSTASYNITYCLGAATGNLTVGTHVASPAGM